MSVSSKFCKLRNVRNLNSRTLRRLRFLSFVSQYFKNIETRAKRKPYHYCNHQYTFFVYLLPHLFFFKGCQTTCFKNSSYIFFKSGGNWSSSRFVCSSQGGDLVSIETEEEWQFINNEIKNRYTWNTSVWHIGLRKIKSVWTWESGEQLNISKWRDSEPDDSDKRAEISKNGSLFNGIPENHKSAFICEMLEGKIRF